MDLQTNMRHKNQVIDRSISLVPLPHCSALSLSRGLIHARFSVSPSSRHARLFKSQARRDPNGPRKDKMMLQRSARFVFPTHSRTDIQQMVFTMWFPYTQIKLFELMTKALADGSNVLRSKEEPLEPFLQPGGLLSSPPFASTFPRPPSHRPSL